MPLTTERLILRPFREEDVPALFAIYSDKKTNVFLPWFPLETMEEARSLFETRYAHAAGWRYAVCLRTDDVPIGYVHLGAGDSHDLGYGLRSEFWHRGIVSEACAAVIGQARRDGVPYLTATHDVNNPRSGAVMQRCGMQYQYTYREQWQPKNFPVLFRMYQLNLHCAPDFVYRKYWNQYEEHFVETL